MQARLYRQQRSTGINARAARTLVLSAEEIDTAEYHFERASEALRPFLTPDERVVLDWMGDQMFGEAHISADQLADQIGRSRRTIYKIRDRLILKLKKERK
jgi:DNA-binding CsgD family transcriptional regulator